MLVKERMLEWLECQEDKLEERHMEQMATLKGIHKRELIWYGVGVILTMIIITIVGAAIEAQWIPEWFGFFG